MRAFIKQYADTVGLDGDELLTQFQQDIPEPQPQEYAAQSVENKTRATRAEEASPVNRLRRYLPQIAIAAFVIVAIIVIYVVMLFSQSGPKQTIPRIPRVLRFRPSAVVLRHRNHQKPHHPRSLASLLHQVVPSHQKRHLKKAKRRVTSSTFLLLRQMVLLRQLR